LFNVGLIRAATDLVIVNTPDMGSIEGTHELLKFAKRVTDSGDTKLPRSVLVVNRCMTGDQSAAMLKSRWQGDLTGGVVTIEKSDLIERTGRSYRFGDIASNHALWKNIGEIRAALEKNSEVEIKQTPMPGD